ncbi:protein sneaky-like, partial [Colias croceus]|uniref:protein sneaky-like n=1 Tax=Colias crocea TaxID=72248 RepID=UPI001E2811D2
NVPYYVFLGLGNATSIQIRSISLLLLPMYCGKAGRGILKAVVLTYVVAGPITNMALNAKEVVRVFACSTQLSFNLTKLRYSFIATPVRRALISMKTEIGEFKGTLRSIRKVVRPIEIEMENAYEILKTKPTNDLGFLNLFIIFLLPIECNNYFFRVFPNETEIIKYEKNYAKKMEYRCERQMSRAVLYCMEIFSSSFNMCYDSIPIYAGALCWPLMLHNICNIRPFIGHSECNYEEQVNINILQSLQFYLRLGESYYYLKNTSTKIISNLTEVNVLEEIYEGKVKNYQDAKETSLKVLQAFEEKYNIVKLVVLGVHICLALLFLRLLISAQSYHDLYLTSINYDNVYVTGYFKRIDQRRRRKLQCTLLPLKKMERNRYIDVYSTSYIPSERSKLFTQILKVTLEAITATTFVMLDRLFYEALDVVRQYAVDNEPINGLGDVEVEVAGAGFVADMLRKLVDELKSINVKTSITNEECLPQPRAIPALFYVKIYGGYLWILLLLFTNPYTLRLRRLICSYFYPHREKQRILHLYNDILKKRLKMQKTLRRKAVQAVRAHYLSGENLLSLRMRFPHILGWLGALPHARMKCLICEETEPWHRLRNPDNDSWHSCENVKCPFLYCDECWKDIGSSCLACDPALNELSDVDSLSDDRPPRY